MSVRPDKGTATRKILLYLAVVVILCWALVPILWMFLSSFKTQEGMFSLPPKWIFKPTFVTYQYMFSARGGFVHYLVNSLIASVSSMVISLVFGSTGGYALARGRFKRQKGISFWVISTRMAPIPAVILPLYIMFAHLHLLGNMVGLIFAYTTFNLPFALWIMMVFFQDVPESLEEAALIDGCGRFQSFLRVALPVAQPGLIATGILALMFAWNDFLFASIFTSVRNQTIPVAASLLVSQEGIQWGQAMATGTIIILPMVIAGLSVRKYLVRGLSMGAIK